MTVNQEENKKIVQRFHEALNEMDWEKVEELLADNAMFGQPGGPRRLQGSKQIVAFLKNLLANAKSLRLEILDLGAVGPYVIDERNDWVIPKGEDKEWSTPTHVSGSYCVENGRIVDWTEWVSPESRTGS